MQPWKSHVNGLHHYLPSIRVLPGTIKGGGGGGDWIHSFKITHALEHYGNKPSVIINSQILAWGWLISGEHQTGFLLMKSRPGVSSQEGYSGSLCFVTSTTPAGGKGDKAGQREEIARLVLPLYTKENVLLGNCWHLIGNSLKWLTISYPVISLDSPCNGTLTDAHFPFTSKITAISPFASTALAKSEECEGERTREPHPVLLT